MGMSEQHQERIRKIIEENEEAESMVYNLQRVAIELRMQGIEEGITKFYRGTVRSGQLISYDGNIVILGDVNPGAEVQASGNIIVLGWLRGTVHAGMYGNDKAFVASLNLQPVQLRIANIITRPPDEQKYESPSVPEIAFVKDDMIFIESFLPQK